jgi:Ribonuclease HI
MKKVIVYTDGACSKNPGPGGWAAVLKYGNAQKELSGFVADTTNNRMELTAAVMALEALKEPCEVVLHTDSAYIHNAFTQRWIDRWQLNGWRTASRDPVENMDLWRQLLDAAETHRVAWKKVKGHSGDAFNNLCDKLARKQISDHVKPEKKGKGSAAAAEAAEQPR